MPSTTIGRRGSQPLQQQGKIMLTRCSKTVHGTAGLWRQPNARTRSVLLAGVAVAVLFVLSMHVKTLWSVWLSSSSSLACTRHGGETACHSPRDKRAKAFQVYTGSAAVAGGGRYVLPQNSGNVQHLVIPGSVAGPTGEMMTGNLQILIKVLVLPDQDGSYLLRGAVSFAATDLSAYSRIWPERFNPMGNATKQGEEVTPYTPWFSLELELYLRSSDATWQQPLDFILHSVPEFTRRVRLDPGEAYVLAVKGWPHYAEFDPFAAEVGTFEPDAGDQTLYNLVCSPVFGATSELPTLVSMLRHRIRHHAAMGFSGLVFCCAPATCKGLAAHPEAALLMAGGQLYLMPSDDFAAVEGWPNKDKYTLANKALLSFWGTNTRLFVSDLDEYLALPTKGLLQDLLRDGCLAVNHGCITLWTRMVFHESNYAWNWTALEQQVGTGEHPVSPIQLLQRRDVELPSFLFADATSIDAICSGFDCFKSIVNPNTVFDFYMHAAEVCLQFDPLDYTCVMLVPNAQIRSLVAARRQVDSCAFVAHFANQASPRYTPSTESILDTSWLWMYT